MKRFKSFLAGLAVMMTCAPSQAQAQDLFPLYLTGTLNGTQQTYACGPYEFNCTTSSPFAQTFSLEIYASEADLLDGFEYFAYGNPFSNDGIFQGTIVREGDLYIGIDLSFSRTDFSLKFCGTSCFGSEQMATASSFQVSTTPAVPEPATWAMMLLGFGAIGYSLRSRRNAKFAIFPNAPLQND